MKYTPVGIEVPFATQLVASAFGCTENQGGLAGRLDVFLQLREDIPPDVVADVFKQADHRGSTSYPFLVKAYNDRCAYLYPRFGVVGVEGKAKHYGVLIGRTSTDAPVGLSHINCTSLEGSPHDLDDRLSTQ